MEIRDVTGYAIGLDLGQARDYTALSVLRRGQRPTGRMERAFVGVDEFSGRVGYELRPVTETTYDVIHLDRWRGRKYTEVAGEVRQLLDRISQRHRQAFFDAGEQWPSEPAIALVVDQTGVGRAVVDTIRATGLDCRGVTIHAGDSVTQDGTDFRVPKRMLVGVLQVLLQGGRLKIAGALDLAPTLMSELENFRARITLSGHDTYGAGDDWREGNHDDLVLATALAAWAGEDKRCFPTDLSWLSAYLASQYG